jgi:uncharacterized coiled-coil DUF342 family protein
MKRPTPLPSIDYADDPEVDYAAPTALSPSFHTVPPPLPPPTAHERRLAEAIAEVKATHEELRLAYDEIDQLRADLNKGNDRVILLDEERDRFRAEALVFRTKLIELATAMSNISLLCGKANDVVAAVYDLTNAPTISKEQLEALEQQESRNDQS